MAQPRRNPLNVLPVTGNIETDDAAETGAVVDALKAGEAQIEKVMGNGYWKALVFASENQAREFFTALGWNAFTDDTGTYYDGIGIAEKMGVALTPESIPFRGERPDRRLIDEVGIIPGEEKP